MINVSLLFTMELCRACLCTDREFKMITEDCLQNYNLLTQLEVHLNNELPQTMCGNCWNIVDSFIEFRNRCIQSELTLNNNIKNLKLEHDVILDTFKLEEPILDALNQSPDVNSHVDLSDDVVDNADANCGVKIEHKTNIKCRMKAATAKTKQGVFKSRKLKRTDNAKATKEKPPAESDTRMLCGLCEKSYHNRDSLSNHLEDHKKSTTCSLCEESHQPWPRLLGHRLNHLQAHPESCHCHMCREPHTQDFVLEYHYFMEHYDGEFPGLECKQCCKLYPTAQRLKRHIWAYHSSKQYICDHCSKVYHNKHHLSNHLINHSIEKRYFCEKCDFACKLKGGLTEHKLRKHTDVKYKCEGCHAKFGNQESFQKHKTKCQMYVICPTCGKSMNKTNLIQHMKSHSADKPYKCDRCPAMYKSKRALLVHMDKHHSSHPRMGEKRFSCTICDKRYTANHNLKIHLKTHASSIVDRRTYISLESTRLI